MVLSSTFKKAERKSQLKTKTSKARECFLKKLPGFFQTKAAWVEKMGILGSRIPGRNEINWDIKWKIEKCNIGTQSGIIRIRKNKIQTKYWILKIVIVAIRPI